MVVGVVVGIRVVYGISGMLVVEVVVNVFVREVGGNEKYIGNPLCH